MDQADDIIDLCMERHKKPLRHIRPRAAHGFVAVLRNVPSDVTDAYIRVFIPEGHGAYHDVRGHERPNGDWIVRIPPLCIPTAGETKYEVHGQTAEGWPFAGGEGPCTVAPFSIGTAPAEEGEPQTVAELPVEGGGRIQVVMVWDGYDYVMKAIPNEE